MATYTELYNLKTEDELRNRVTVAVLIAANNLLGGTPTADEQKWAAAVFGAPDGQGRVAFQAVIAANSGLTTAQITGASDAAIQTNVDSLVPAMVVAYNASLV